MNVTALKVSDWNKDGTIVKVSNVTFDDGREVPGYDLPPGLEVGKPLPDGWEIATAKSGKPYIKVPKPGKGGGFGGAAAFRNTERGQAIEQDRMDKRTSLMQATALVVAGKGSAIVDMDGRFVGDVSAEWRDLANEMYAWLSGTSVEKGTRASSGPTEEQGSGAGFQGEAPASGPCTHDMTSPLKPDGVALPAGFLRCLGCGLVKPIKDFMK